MKAILINPDNKDITAKEMPDFKAMYGEIGNQCGLVEAVTTFPNEDTLFCDEEGLFHAHENSFIFGVGKDGDEFAEYFIIVGKGIILGCDAADGETIAAQGELEYYKKRVKWNIYRIGKELFITSDEEIKEGDWHIYENEAKKTTKETLDYIDSSGDEGFKKIILTTDHRLKLP